MFEVQKNDVDRKKKEAEEELKRIGNLEETEEHSLLSQREVQKG